MEGRIQDFQNRSRQFKQRGSQAKRGVNALGLARLLVFVGVMMLAYGLYSVELTLYIIPELVLGFFFFGWLVKRFNRKKRQQAVFESLTAINKEEVLRVKLDLKDFFAGEEFLDRLHPYALDMDVFGPHSLYQLVSRAELPEGQKAMAAELLSTSSSEVMLQKQEAAKELSNQIDWRQEFQALARLSDKTKSAHQKFFDWLKEPTRKTKGTLVYYLALVGAVVTPTLFVLWLAELLPGWVPVIGMSFNGALFRARGAEAMALKMGGRDKFRLLTAYKSLFVHAESLEMKSPTLAEIKEKLEYEGQPVSKVIDQLFSILNFIDYTNNALFGILANGVFNWDLLWIARLEGWKKAYAQKCLPWFDALGSLEVHASVAAVAYAQTDWVWPSVQKQFGFTALAMAHPLLSSEIRVSNDVRFEGHGKVMVLTGSNMSGKSTFLRTLGTNLILANLGAPVSSSTFALSEIYVFSSMRNTDSLEESTSSFYAELKRLHQLLEVVETTPNVFFMLDEILKGTNSVDRHAGAQGLIYQLLAKNQTGIVSTHDLELCKLADELPDQVMNFSFNSTIADQKIRFDYKLTPGPCKSFNASQLMENMGISVRKPA